MTISIGYNVNNWTAHSFSTHLRIGFRTQTGKVKETDKIASIVSTSIISPMSVESESLPVSSIGRCKIASTMHSINMQRTKFRKTIHVICVTKNKLIRMIRYFDVSDSDDVRYVWHLHRDCCAHNRYDMTLYDDRTYNIEAPAIYMYDDVFVSYLNACLVYAHSICIYVTVQWIVVCVARAIARIVRAEAAMHRRSKRIGCLRLTPCFFHFLAQAYFGADSWMLECGTATDN